MSNECLLSKELTFIVMVGELDRVCQGLLELRTVRQRAQFVERPLAVSQVCCLVEILVEQIVNEQFQMFHESMANGQYCFFVVDPMNVFARLPRGDRLVARAEVVGSSRSLFRNGRWNG